MPTNPTATAFALLPFRFEDRCEFGHKRLRQSLPLVFGRQRRNLITNVHDGWRGYRAFVPPRAKCFCSILVGTIVNSHYFSVSFSNCSILNRDFHTSRTKYQQGRPDPRHKKTFTMFLQDNYPPLKYAHVDKYTLLTSVVFRAQIGQNYFLQILITHTGPCVQLFRKP